MNKKKWILSVLLFVLTATILLLVFTQPFGYHRVLNANWKWELPAGYTELCGYDDADFHGDGLRYHVLQYRKTGTEKINRMFFGSEPGTDLSETAAKVSGWLTELGVPADEYPPFEVCVCIAAGPENDGSEMVLFWDAAKGILYAVESFF